MEYICCEDDIVLIIYCFIVLLFYCFIVEISVNRDRFVKLLYGGINEEEDLSTGNS